VAVMSVTSHNKAIVTGWENCHGNFLFLFHIFIRAFLVCDNYQLLTRNGVFCVGIVVHNGCFICDH
jgi:hypothetical protein